MLIDKNDIQKVVYQGIDVSALYLGNTLIWSMDKTYRIMGTFVRGTNATDRWLYYNGEKHYLDTEFDLDVQAVEYKVTGLTQPFASDKIETLVLPYIKNFTNANYMFDGCNRLLSIDLSNLDTSNVTSMFAMFSHCEYLENVDISNFNMKNVTNCNLMFSYCKKLQSIDFSNLNLENITSFRGLLFSCDFLKSVYFDNVTTNSLTDMSSMFSYCPYITSLDLSSLTTLNVTTMDSMFIHCDRLETLNIDGWDFNKVTNTNNMFDYCSVLTTVTGNISNLNTSISLSMCPLERESAMVFINGLKASTTYPKKTITFARTTYDYYLTQSDIAVGTSKGWTVASA